MQNAIEMQKVNAGYDNYTALEDINLKIKNKEFVGIIGPNGGGKTTLLKIILGILKPKKGTIKIFGKSPEKGRELIGYVPQSFSFDRTFPITVLELVLMGRIRSNEIFFKYSKQDNRIAKNALKKVEMLKHAKKHLSHLSGGQLQRVLIARALATEPKMLLLDEPVSSIDPEMQKSFYKLLLKLKKEMAIVLVTHDVGVSSTYVDSLACLNKKLYHHGSVEGGIKKLEKIYQCPVEIIAHGQPHRVLKRHKK